MSAKHTPATPLPWHSAHESVKGPHRRRVVNAAINSCGIQAAYQDAAYVAHAANAYPRLVEALLNVLHAGDMDFSNMEGKAFALLRELREDA